MNSTVSLSLRNIYANIYEAVVCISTVFDIIINSQLSLASAWSSRGRYIDRQRNIYNSLNLYLRMLTRFSYTLYILPQVSMLWRLSTSLVFWSLSWRRRVIKPLHGYIRLWPTREVIYDVSFTFCFPLDVYLIVAVCQAFQRVRTWNLQAYLSRSPFAFPFAFAQPKCSPPQYEIHSCHTTRVRRL